MKSNFFNKAKLSCKTIAMILVAAIVIVSVDGCGKSETGVSSGTGAGVKTIQVDTAVDRIPAEPIEEAALALQAAYEKLEASTGDDAAFAQALQAFHETLVKYQSVYNGTEGEKDKEYQSRIETALHQAEELENVNLTDREQKMNLLRQYMGEPDSVHTYGDQLIEGDEPDVETRKVESFEAAREKMENAAEEEVDGTPKGKQKTAGRKNLLTEGSTALSDVMKAKADELKTPLAIYNELKNTLQYENYCGSRKGAIAAYDALSGNDVDQASVLIAMLRYLGYEAVYAEGDILLDPDQAMALTGAGNVTAAANALALGGKKSTLLVAGGKPAGVSIRHTWVRTLVPYGDYRGAGKNSGKKRWIDLDVSFKQYEDTGKNIYDDGEGLGIDGQAILEQYKQGKTDMLDSLLASGEVSEKAEGMYGVRKKIREQTVAYLPLSLPYPAEDVDCYEMIDDGQSDRLCITVGNAPLGTYTSSELYGKRVVLEYRPATEEDGERIRQAGGIFRAAADQVQMVPVLKIDGQAMAEGEAVYLGSSENMRMDVFSGNTSYSSDNRVTAGSVYQFSLDTQSITPAELEKARLDAEAVKDRVDTDTVYSDEYLGALLKYAGTMYFAQIDVVNRLLAEADEIVSVRNLSVGITEYEVQSIRALGRVVGIQEGSLCIDVDMDVHSRTSLRLDDEACVAYSFAYGMAASRFEDVIWHEFTGQDCISTMSIFERAEKEGIGLVTLNEKSYNENISRVSADKATLSAVKSAVNRGLTVIIPERGMEWDDWEGTGYLILNPETGAGEYMISGGLSGGSTSTAVTIAGICAIIAQIAMMALFTIMVGSMLSAVFAAALIMQLYYIVCMFMMMLSMVFMSERTTAMILSLKQYASGNTSREEYILKEFRQTAVELALLVVCMSVDRYMAERIQGGTTGEKIEGEGSGGSEGEAGGTGGGEGGNGGTGNGSGGTSDGGSGGTGSGNGGTNDGGTGGTGSNSGGTGDGGSGGTGTGGTGSSTGGSGGAGSGEGTGTGGSSEGGGTGTSGGSGAGESGVETGKNLKPQELLDELANSGVKYTPEDVILVTKMADGKLVWLERGNDRAGLTHIVNRHAKDFAKRGISDIPQFLNDVLQLKPIKTSAGDRGLTAEFFINGKKYKVAYGTNGYVVSFYPIDSAGKGK